jgi:hypothetical protein
MHAVKKEMYEKYFEWEMPAPLRFAVMYSIEYNWVNRDTNEIMKSINAERLSAKRLKVRFRILIQWTEDSIFPELLTFEKIIIEKIKLNPVPIIEINSLLFLILFPKKKIVMLASKGMPIVRGKR